jgi:DNA modification methylase
MDRPSWLKPKDLVGMPWRVAFALQADGWYLRSDIIWSKPNPMPESVTDRPTKSHEYIFLLTKKPRYYYDADAVREPQDTIGKMPFYDPKNIPKPFFKEDVGVGVAGKSRWDKPTGEDKAPFGYEHALLNPAGRNRRTVWEIATQPFPGSHFATFPEALVEPCIKAGTSERGCCSVCGAPWKRVVEASEEYKKLLGSRIIDETYVGGTLARGKTFTSKTPKITSDYITIRWQPSCSCNADTVPCVVLDPFGGSGTVGKVARDLNRKAILIELNAEYIKIARERLRLNEQLGAFA